MYLTMFDLLWFVAVVIAAFSGYMLHFLSLSGSFATILIGVATFAGFGVQGLLLMATFFVTSSMWSKITSTEKKRAEEKNEKSGARDAVQVFANGGIPAVLSILYLFYQDAMILYGFIGALATSNSDTWASEIGSLSRNKPIQLTTWHRVEAGTSGAVSILGTVAASLGALLIGMVSIFIWPSLPMSVGLKTALAGFLGNLVDTFLGAIQVTYTCPICHLHTEKRWHCHKKTTYKSGFLFLNNDIVNVISIAIGSCITILIFSLWS